MWRDHSKTIVGMVAGVATCAAARLIWPDGGSDFDIATIVGGVLLGFGVQGVLDYRFREVAKPEDPPPQPRRKST